MLQRPACRLSAGRDPRFRHHESLCSQIQHPLLVFAGIQLLLAFDVILVINQFDLLSRVMALIQILLGVQSHASHVLLLFFGVFQVLILPTLLFGAKFSVSNRSFCRTFRGNRTRGRTALRQQHLWKYSWVFLYGLSHSPSDWRTARLAADRLS